jgi:hypothetical protein
VANGDLAVAIGVLSVNSSFVLADFVLVAFGTLLPAALLALHPVVVSLLLAQRFARV